MISAANPFAHERQNQSDLNRPLARFVAAVLDSLNEATRLFHQMKSRQIQLKNLRHLDERMLRDIGLTKTDVRGEMVKPIWKC